MPGQLTVIKDKKHRKKKPYIIRYIRMWFISLIHVVFPPNYIYFPKAKFVDKKREV